MLKPSEKIGAAVSKLMSDIFYLDLNNLIIFSQFLGRWDLAPGYGLRRRC